MEEQEYETQFFGFNPKAFTDAVYNAKYDYVHNAIRVLHDFLTSQFPNVDRQRMIKGSEQLRTEILKSAEKICDKLEVYISRNIFVIPEHVTLPEDVVQLDGDVIASDDLRLDDELLLLDSRIRSVASNLSDCSVEKRRLESTIDSYEATLTMVQKMDRMQLNHDIEKAMSEGVKKSTELIEAVQNI